MAQSHAAVSPAQRRLQQDERTISNKHLKGQLKAQSRVIDKLHSKLSQAHATEAVHAVDVAALKRQLAATKTDLATETQLLNEANEKNWLVQKEWQAKLVEEQSKSVLAQATKAKAEAALQSEATVMAHLTEEDSRAQKEAASLHAELDQEKSSDASALKALDKEKATVKSLETEEAAEQLQSEREEAALRSEVTKHAKLYSELKATFDKTNATLTAVEESHNKEIKNLRSQETILNKTFAQEQREYAELRLNDTRDAAKISADIASKISAMQKDFQKQVNDHNDAIQKVRAKGIKAINALQGQLAVQNDRASTAEKSAERLRLELADKTKAILEQNQSRVILEQGLRDQLEAQKATAAATAEQAAEVLSMRTHERDDAKAQLQRESGEEAELRQELASAQKSLSELKANVTRASKHWWSR